MVEEIKRASSFSIGSFADEMPEVFASSNPPDSLSATVADEGYFAL